MNTLSLAHKGYLSKQTAAAYADVSIRALERAVERGDLTAFRLVLSGKRSHKILFRKTDIDEWIGRFEVNGPYHRKWMARQQPPQESAS